MNTMTLGEKPLSPVRLALAGLTFAFALALAACGGGGVVPSTSAATTDVAGNQSRTQTPEWAEFISRKAVAYSPFRTDDRDAEIAGLADPARSAAMTANIKQDLDLLVLGNFRLIRLFDSNDGPIDPTTKLPTDGVPRKTLQIIRDNKLDIKVQLGAYIVSESSPYISDSVKASNKVLNLAEVERCVALANEFKDIVLAVSVGNETMVSWSFVPTDPTIMAGYITSVRSRVPQPVTTDDNWAFYASAPKIITDAIDFASIHTYAELDTKYPEISWNWKQSDVSAVPPAGATAADPNPRAAAMMNAAIAAAKSDYDKVRAYLDMKGQAIMPITVGETGWNAVDLGELGFRAHPVNQKMYFLALEAWAKEGKTGAGPANIFYFEAFDEPWKGGDDKWGLFNVNRQARYVVQSLYPATMWEPGTYTLANALYWTPMTNHKVVSNRYTLYADNYTLNEDKLPQPPLWNAWADGTTAKVTSPDLTKCVAPPDGTNCVDITPTPAPWGWGLALNMKEADGKTDTSADLSDFAAGFLNFSIQTTYPGMIEVGFYSGRGADSTGKDVYIQLAPGDYGYLNDGAWHQVAIPVSVLLAAGAATVPNGLAADLTKVTSPFVIADRYEKTGKAQGSNIRTKIDVDAIFWSR